MNYHKNTQHTYSSPLSVLELISLWVHQAQQVLISSCLNQTIYLSQILLTLADTLEKLTRDIRQSFRNSKILVYSYTVDFLLALFPDNKSNFAPGLHSPKKRPERIYFIGKTSSSGIQVRTHSSTSPKSEQHGGQGLTIVNDKDAPAVVMVFQVLPWYVLVEEVEGSVSPLPRHFLTDQHIQQTHGDHPQILLGVYIEAKQ